VTGVLSFKDLQWNISYRFSLESALDQLLASLLREDVFMGSYSAYMIAGVILNFLKSPGMFEVSKRLLTCDFGCQRIAS
jgi:hypothetical protein